MNPDQELAVKAIEEIRGSPQPVLLEISKTDVLCVTGLLQMALRHPGVRETHSYQTGVSIVRAIQHALAKVHPTVGRIIEMGFDPSQDAASPEDRALEFAPQPSRFDAEQMAAIVAGEHHHFSAHLLRLIKKADAENRERLRQVYPHHVAALEAWEGGSSGHG